MTRRPTAASDLPRPESASPDEEVFLDRRELERFNLCALVIVGFGALNILWGLITTWGFVPERDRVLYGSVVVLTSICTCRGLANLRSEASEGGTLESWKAIRNRQLLLMLAWELPTSTFALFQIPPGTATVTLMPHFLFLTATGWTLLLLPALADALVISGVGLAIVTLYLTMSDSPYVLEVLLANLALLPFAVLANRWLLRRMRSRWLVELRWEKANRQLSEANHLLEDLATHDALTGLSNRDGMLPELQALLAPGGTDATAVAVLFIDVDRFKVVNDSLGHAAGDRLLQEVSTRINTLLGTQATGCRAGGDEFVLAMSVEDMEEARTFAERIRSSMAEPIHLEDRELVITVSIGIALARPGEAADRAIRNADAALYRAKANGRDRVELFDDDLHQDLATRFEEEQALRRAIEEGGVEPWYQPEVDLATGRIVGAEVLARYHHQSRGLLSAQEFLTFAGEVGLFDLCSQAVMDSAIAWRASLARTGVSDEFRLRIHVSPSQISLAGFANALSETISRHGCPPEAILVEVNQTELIADIRRAAEQLTAVRDLGCRVVLDDFGTGHSSIPLLLEVDVDGVKLDRQVVSDLDSAEGRALLKTLLGLARRLGTNVCADGVETTGQAKWLRESGCTTAHGFLWSDALSGDALLDQLEGDMLPAGVGSGS